MCVCVCVCERACTRARLCVWVWVCMIGGWRVRYVLGNDTICIGSCCLHLKTISFMKCFVLLSYICMLYVFLSKSLGASCLTDIAAIEVLCIILIIIIIIEFAVTNRR